MKKLFIILLICTSANIQAQPSLSSFTNSTQRTQLANYVIWQAKTEAKKAADSTSLKIWEAIRQLQAQNKRDSINYVNDNAKLSSLIISTPKSLADSMAAVRKSLKDSMATLLPVTSVNATIDSIMNVYKVDFDKQIKALQDAGKITEADVLVIKQWMRNNFKF